jgi:opacity protein-like surface antigen
MAYSGGFMGIKTLSAFAIAGAALVCSSVYADPFTGVYVGGQVGYGSINSDHHYWGNNSDDGFAGRPYIGYQLNQYFGIETGYTFFSDNDHTWSDGLGNVLKLKTSVDQWDILLKVGMPFGCSGFRGDVKIGAADVMPDGKLTLNGTEVASSHDDDQWDPAAGVGVSYFLNKNVAVDVSYLHTFGSGNQDFDTDLVTLGVAYYFS